MAESLLVIDLEATCWESRSEHRGENEIIEVGLAIVSSENEIVWNGGWFVRPILNPLLSEFCTRLTSIVQSDVDGALSLPRVLEELQAKQSDVTGKGLGELTFVSWGDYDRNQFQRDCKRHGIRYPFGAHVNLKKHFAEKHGGKKRGLGEALAVLGLEFEGTHHRGKDDAMNIARILTVDFGVKYPFISTDS